MDVPGISRSMNTDGMALSEVWHRLRILQSSCILNKFVFRRKKSIITLTLAFNFINVADSQTASFLLSFELIKFSDLTSQLFTLNLLEIKWPPPP